MENTIQSKSNDTLVLNLLALWFVSQLFFNDITNLWTIKYIINIRPDRIIFLLLLISFWGYLRKSGSHLRVDPAEKMMILFFFVALISCIVSGNIKNPYNRHISTIFNLMGIPMVTFYITRRLSYDELKIKKLLSVFILMGAYLGLTGIFEHYNLSFLIFPKYILDPGVGIHFGRARGPFVHSVVFGNVINIILMITLFYITNIGNKAICWLVLGAAFIASYFSYTRSVWIGLFTSIVLLVLSPKSRKYAIIFLILTLLIYVSGVFGKFSFMGGTLFSRRDEPIYDRLNIMQASLNMISQRPLFGFGYGGFEKDYDEYFSKIKGVPLVGQGEGNHNAILGIMVELGLAGTLPYLMIFYYFVQGSLRVARQGISKSLLGSELGIYNLAILFGYMVNCQLFDPRFFAILNSMIFFLSGLVFSARDHSL